MPPRQGRSTPPIPTTCSSSGPASGAASRRCGSPRRATASASSRRAAGSRPRRCRRRRGTSATSSGRPRLGCYGIQRIHVLRDVVVLAGAGVGGGSLNYANTLYRPKSDAFYRDPQWASHHRLARRAGPVLRPGDPDARRRHAAVGDAVGRGDAPGRGRARARATRSAPTQVGVYFGEGPGVTVARPVLRRRRARAHRLPRVRRVHDRLPPRRQEHPRDELPRAGRAGGRGGAPGDDGAHGPARPRTGYAVETRATRRRGGGRRHRAEQVVFAAGTWGTQTLLHRLRDTACCRASRASSAS